MTKLRRWLHRHGQHRFCRITIERKVVDRDLRPRFLVGRDGEKLDVSVFGGEPVYGPRTEIHR